MNMKKKEKEASRSTSFFPSKKDDFNEDIYEAEIERMKELKLLPESQDDFGQRFIRYYPGEKWINTASVIARRIVREQPDIKLEELLSQKDKEIISKVAEGKGENTIFTNEAVIHEFEEEAKKHGLSLDGRWYFRWITSEEKLRRTWLPCGFAAELFFMAVLYKDQKDPWINYPRHFLELLNTPLKDLNDRGNGVMGIKLYIPAPNTHEDIIWRYIDTMGLDAPTRDLLKDSEKVGHLKNLNLLPSDPKIWLSWVEGLQWINNRYKEEKNTLINKGVHKEVFEKLENICFQKGIEDALKKSERLQQPFFFFAFLLKGDYPGLYEWYLKEVKSFISEKLVSKNIRQLATETDDLQGKLEKLKFSADMLSEYGGKAEQLSEEQATSIAIDSGLSVKRLKGSKGNRAHSGYEGLINEPDVPKKKRDELKQVKEEYERKKKELIEEAVRNEVEIKRFKNWLETDFLLGCVFFYYVFDGFKKLKLKRPPHRPPEEILGRMIVDLVDELTPSFKENPSDKENKAQVHRTVSGLLAGLIGQELGNKKIKDFYYRYSRKSI